MSRKPMAQRPEGYRSRILLAAAAVAAQAGLDQGGHATLHTLASFTGDKLKPSKTPPAEPTEAELAKIAKAQAKRERRAAKRSPSFLCCGGSDEHPPEHTQDCPDRAQSETP